MHVHTQTVGSGPRTLVYLHGLLGRGRNFLSSARTLENEQRSVLVDLPNHGESSWTDSFTYPDTADIVAEVIGDIVRRSGPVDLLGHSLGGKVAMVIALRHPELIDRLIVEDIAPVDYPPLPADLRGTVHDNAYLLETLANLDLGALTSRGEADALLTDAIPDRGVRGFLLQNLQRTDDGFRWQPNLDLLRRSMSTINDFPGIEASFSGETLWLAGARSRYVRGGDRPAMLALFPEAHLLTVRNCGHWIHSEQPAVFADVLRGFLERRS